MCFEVSNHTRKRPVLLTLSVATILLLASIDLERGSPPIAFAPMNYYWKFKIIKNLLPLRQSSQSLV